MENKQSFYKTFDEKLLKGVVDAKYNDYVGGNENHFLDTNEIYWDFDEKTLCERISSEILNEKKDLWSESGDVIEAKHIRFMGKNRVEEIVKHRVAFRHTHDSWIWEAR